MSEEKVVTVGLDMSLTGTGFATKNGNISIKTIKTVPKDFPNDLERLKYIVKTVMDSIPKDTKLIVIEDVFTPQANQIGSAMKLIMLAGLIRMALYDAKLPFFLAAPSQIKKHLSGKGTCPKDQVTKEVYKKYGIDTKDNNQADAVAMAYLASDLYDYIKTGECGNCTKPQAEVIKKIAHERPSYNVDIKKTVDVSADNLPIE